jgi:hypothetical protein
MSLDLLAYAAHHRLRTRNLHDGRPVPPMRPRKGTRPTGYAGRGDRCDAVIGRHGYVTTDGAPAGTIGWCVVCQSARGLTPRLEALRQLGVTVAQCGHSEAAGLAPVALLDEVLAIIQPFRRKPPPAQGSSALQNRRQQAGATVG